MFPPHIMQTKPNQFIFTFTQHFNLGSVQKSIFDGITMICNKNFHAVYIVLKS